MSEQNISKVIGYHRFVLCTDKPVKVARRDDPSSAAFFCFNDDTWDPLDLLRPHERDYDARLNFSSIAAWLRPDAKRYMAYLWLRAGPEPNLLQQIMVSLRDLGRHLPGFQGRPIDLRARDALSFSRSYAQQDIKNENFRRTRRNLNRFISFVRQQHPEIKDNDFEVRFPKNKTQPEHPAPLEQSQEARVSGEVFAQVIDACIADTKAYTDYMSGYIDPIENRKEYQKQYDSECYYKKKQGLHPHRGNRGKRPHLLGRAIKAQATILAACVGRRPAMICNTKADVKTEVVEWTDEAGNKARGVSVRFRETKVSNTDEEVFCPEAYGELAVNAIRTATELTADLRRHNPQWKDYLFLIPGKDRNSARVLSTAQLSQYINGQWGWGGGLIKRYNIPVEEIQTQNFRHNRATNLWLGGLQVYEVSYDLGHASAEMAIRHYIVGNEESRRRLQFLMNHKALGGVLEDFIGGKEMVEARIGRRHVEIMKKQGRIISPTRYGYCCLPAASGPCIRTTPCYIGPGANAGGCDYHVLSPDALDALSEDEEVLKANIETYSGDPDYSAWVTNQRNQLEVVELNIRRAAELNQRLGKCQDGNCTCDGKKKDGSEGGPGE